MQKKHAPNEPACDDLCRATAHNPKHPIQWHVIDCSSYTASTRSNHKILCDDLRSFGTSSLVHLQTPSNPKFDELNMHISQEVRTERSGVRRLVLRNRVQS